MVSFKKLLTLLYLDFVHIIQAPQPAPPVQPLPLQSVPIDYTSSISSTYRQQPPGFVLRASVPNEGESTTIKRQIYA